MSQAKPSERGRNHNLKADKKAAILFYFPTPPES